MYTKNKLLSFYELCCYSENMNARRADQISESLEQLIFRGDYKDGQRLDEIKLAAKFNVSRTPIREALQRLVFSGLAEQLPRRGVFIRQPGAIELMEMFETMAELEGACGRFASNGRCREAVERDNVVDYYDENEIFHKEIYRGSTNAFLERQTLHLQNRLKPYRRVQLHFRGRMLESLKEHEAIVEALQKGDADGAEKMIKSHVTVQGEKFHQLMAGLKPN
jgi:DNA-binding GntR family transcriptional regulator